MLVAGPKPHGVAHIRVGRRQKQGAGCLSFDTLRKTLRPILVGRSVFLANEC